MPDPTPDGVPSDCPQCQTSLTALRGTRWCLRCEWNLNRYDPARHGRAFGWRWLDRWAYHTAYRLNARLYAGLAGGDLTTRPSAARLTVIAVSVGLLALLAAMLASGLFLVVANFPSLAMLPGTLLVLVALVLRPRFGRADPLLERLDPDQAPALFGLVDRVAAELGVRRPDVIGVDRSYGAYAGAVGLRRRRVLALGLPLWVTLPPPQQVALLAHELGHFANGDVRRGPLTQPMFRTLGLVAELARPRASDFARDGALVVFTAPLRLVQWLISQLLWSLHLVLVWIGLRDGQRAEYLADDRAAAVAGSAGARGLIDSLVVLDASEGMVARAARNTGEVAAWREAAATTRERLAGDLAQRQQLSIADEASLFASHPPLGLRRGMLDARPWRDARVGVTEQEATQIDHELAPYYARARRDLGTPH